MKKHNVKLFDTQTLIHWRTPVIFILVAGWLGSSVNAHAEYLGLINGRTAKPDNIAELSAELGLAAGNLDVFDYQNIAARVNYRISDNAVLIGDIGISEFDTADGTPYGLGLLYYLSNQRISQQLDIAGKASYHRGSYDSREIDRDLSSLAVEILISGRQPVANQVNWYANVGYHRITVKLNSSDSTNEIGLGGGFVLDTGEGEAYAGVDYIDELVFGIGFRYFVQ